MKNKNSLLLLLTCLLVLPVSLIMMAMSGPKRKRTDPAPKGPCDIYGATGTPCVAAHSSTRALYAAYKGPLYQVTRESDGKTLDIGVLPRTAADQGGYADAAAQDNFCANTLCMVSKIYDQSGNGNDLLQAPPGTFKGPAKGGFDNLPIADMAPITINGHKAYGIYIMPGMGFRNNNASNIAVNDEPEGIYYVVNGKHYDSGCCFDYGNSSTNGRAVGTGTMETTYYGTSTVWGSGNGNGPWIMTDMEAGLFSGYNSKKNDVPAITDWRFVTAIVDGGGGDKWDLRGGNAQQGGLTTFYSGVRPGSPAGNAYFPMHKKGGILLGTGGDNGNGSAGTFYEGVITAGYPAAAATDAIQANVVAARYEEQRLKLSRIITFTPRSKQQVTLTFTNTTGATATNVKMSLLPRKGWTASVAGSKAASRMFAGPVAPNASVSATFSLTSPANDDAGYLSGKAEWKTASARPGAEMVTQRVRNALAVKINEVGFGTANNPAGQFIELYNAAATPVDISNWDLIYTQSGWASLSLAKVPPATKLAAHGFYLLELGASGLAAPAIQGDNLIHVQNVTGFEPGQKIDIDGEAGIIAKVGSPATLPTTLFIPVCLNSRFTYPAGTTNLPVTGATGFVVGEKVGIDIGGNDEVATVTAVGKAATQANLSEAAKAGSITIKVSDNSNMTPGDALTIGTGNQKEVLKVRRIGKVVSAPARGAPAGEPGEVELAAPLKLDHMVGVDVYEPGTGISFSPATRFEHQSGDAVQALGSGITLENKLTKGHRAGAAIINALNAKADPALPRPNQWFGNPLSLVGGALALMNANNKVIVDALVYGSQQSNSSANGTITSPEIATLEGDQTQGGCIVVVPFTGRGQSAGMAGKSVGRYPDGYDSDNNCRDFLVQGTVSLAVASEAGTKNIKVTTVADFSIGQKVTIGSGADKETALIADIGTTGGTATTVPVDAGTKMIPVQNILGFNIGQTITVDHGANSETATVSAVFARRRRPGDRTGSDSIAVVAPLKYAHPVNTPVSGTGITFSAPLKQAHEGGTQIVGYTPTPGTSNKYTRKH